MLELLHFRVEMWTRMEQHPVSFSFALKWSNGDNWMEQWSNGHVCSTFAAVGIVHIILIVVYKSKRFIRCLSTVTTIFT